MAHNLRQELRHCVQHRVSVFWRCNGTSACSTGILIEVGYDYIELVGNVPTFAETDESPSFDCDDPQGLLLETIIPLKSIGALVEGVPSDRKCTIPHCCTAPSSPHP